MPNGTIARLLIDKGFGFIRDESGVEHFFHRSSVRGAVFELLRDSTCGVAYADYHYVVRRSKATSHGAHHPSGVEAKEAQENPGASGENRYE